MYKLIKDLDEQIKSVQRLSDNAFIPFDPANTDYQTFRTQILEGLADLEDADGVLMSKEQAKAYVETLGVTL
jgi:hypothetical protein